MGLFSFLKPAAEYQEEIFQVAGVDYYLGALQSLAQANPDWKLSTKALKEQDKLMRKIFRFRYINKPVELIPEPKNPHDKHAVMVQINGQKVGYISREQNQHVKEILRKHDVKFISSFITGGEYKVVSEDGHAEKLTDSIRINVKLGYK